MIKKLFLCLPVCFYLFAVPNLQAMIVGREHPKRTTQELHALMNSYAQIQTKVESVPTDIILQCADGDIKVDRAVVNRCKTLKGFCQIPQQVCSVQALDLKCVSHSCDTKTVKNLVEMIKNGKSSEKLPVEQLEKLALLSDDLAAPQSIRQELFEQLVQKIDTRDLKYEQYKLLSSNNVRGIFPVKYSNNGFIVSGRKNYIGWLCLSGLNLKSLESIGNEDQNKLREERHYIEQRRKAIEVIDIAHNEIRELNIIDLKEVFPKLMAIDANHNRIETLSTKDILSLKSGSELSLSNNCIKKISGSNWRLFTPKNCLIDVSNNNLTQDQIENLKSILEPSVIQKNNGIMLDVIINGGSLVAGSFLAINGVNIVKNIMVERIENPGVFFLIGLCGLCPLSMGCGALTITTVFSLLDKLTQDIRVPFKNNLLLCENQAAFDKKRIEQLKKRWALLAKQYSDRGLSDCSRIDHRLKKESNFGLHEADDTQLCQNIANKYIMRGNIYKQEKQEDEFPRYELMPDKSEIFKRLTTFSDKENN